MLAFKNHLTIFIFLSIIFCFPINATIHETAHFSEIINHVKPDTLIILDIDDTLLIPKQTLGTDVWFLDRLKQFQKQGYSQEDSLRKALSQWEAIRHLTEVKIVENGTQAIIQQLQAQNAVVMGLTTQGLALATCTVNQLKGLGIDLTKTAPSKQDYYFINQHGVLYRNGLLFTSGTPKGPALLKLLGLLQYSPTHIVFINDKLTHLKDVGEAVEAAGIEFTGLRYSYSDERVKRYRRELADAQWKYSTFGSIISDEAAELLILQ